jgi:hypothetical protein
MIDTPDPARIMRMSARFSASVHSFGFDLGDSSLKLAHHWFGRGKIIARRC